MAGANDPYFGEMMSISGQKSGGAIRSHRFVKVAADGDVEEATAGDESVIGVNPTNATIPSGRRLDFGNCGPVRGTVPVVADAPINEGERLKAATEGKAIPLVTAELSGDAIHASAAGGNFGNQPSNDGVEVISSDAGDTQSCTIYGTTQGADTVVKETVTLNGTTQVATTKTDWGVILGVELGSAAVGTVTIREASANATITTITAGNSSAGVESVTAANQRLGLNVAPTAVAGGASTKQIGLVGTAADGTEQLDSQALNGTTAVTMNSAFRTVTKVLDGDVATGTATTISVGAQDSDTLSAARAIEAAAAAGDLIYVATD